MNEPRLPGLGGLATILRWCEELLSLLNGPILMLGAGIALVDLLSDGALVATSVLFLYAWAVSQALGIDTQLLGCFARARESAREHHPWQLVGWLILGGVLGYAAWQAGYVFAVQQSRHLSEAAALGYLHMDPATWLAWRAFLAVGLVALSGWTRYHDPKRAQTGTDDAPELEHPDMPPAVWRPLPPPTGPGTPVAAPAAAGGSNGLAAGVSARGGVVKLAAKRRRGRHLDRTASAERRVRAVWHDGMTVGQLERAAKIGRSTASKWHALLTQEPPERMAQ